jgi:hypothetical protein
VSVLREVQRRADGGLRVVFARGEEMERNLPFGLAIQALARLPSQLTA